MSLSNVINGTGKKIAIGIAALIAANPAIDTSRAAFDEFFNRPKSNYGFLYADEVEGGTKINSITIDEYYNRALPLNKYNVEGLRMRPFNPNDGTDITTEITTKMSKLPDNYQDGKFTRLYSTPVIRQALDRTFEKYGFDSKNMELFFTDHKNEKGLSIYHDGYLLLFDEKERVTYILKIPPNMAKDLTSG